MRLFTARCTARTMPSQDVCLSLCLSVTRRYSVETVIHILRLFLHSGSRTILVFFRTKHYGKIRRGPPNVGVECKGCKKLRFSTNTSLYLGNDTRYRANIVTMEGEYMKPYPSFRMVPVSMPLSDLSRSRYYSTSTNSKRFQWQTDRKSYMSYRLVPHSWPWITPNPKFKVTFDVECVRNGKVQTYHYNGVFEWP